MTFMEKIGSRTSCMETSGSQDLRILSVTSPNVKTIIQDLKLLSANSATRASEGEQVPSKRTSVSIANGEAKIVVERPVQGGSGACKVAAAGLQRADTGTTGPTITRVGSQTAKILRLAPRVARRITKALPQVSGDGNGMSTVTCRQMVEATPVISRVDAIDRSFNYYSKTNKLNQNGLSWIDLSAQAIPLPDALSQVIHGKWKCHQQIGSGSFGNIFLATNIEDGGKVAVKTEPIKAKHPQLLHEAKILRSMQGIRPTLEELFFYWANRILSLSTIAIIGLQMLERIQALHSRGFIHRDIKPENFLIGAATNTYKVYCIDFGLARRYRDPKTQVHMRYSDGRSLTGTARYASINTHLGIEPTRRDDLLSICYTLLYLVRGRLPWQGLRAATKNEKYLHIMEKKIKISLEQLTVGLPSEMNLECSKKYLYNCKMNFVAQIFNEPDYPFLKELLRSIAVGSNLASTPSPMKTNHYPRLPSHVDLIQESVFHKKDVLIQLEKSFLQYIENEAPKSTERNFDRTYGPWLTTSSRCTDQSGTLCPVTNAPILYPSTRNVEGSMCSRPVDGKATKRRAAVIFCMACTERDNGSD